MAGHGDIGHRGQHQRGQRANGNFLAQQGVGGGAGDVARLAGAWRLILNPPGQHDEKHQPPPHCKGYQNSRQGHGGSALVVRGRNDYSSPPP